MFSEAKPRGNIEVGGKQILPLFPEGPVVKCFCYTSQLKNGKKNPKCFA